MDEKAIKKQLYTQSGDSVIPTILSDVSSITGTLVVFNNYVRLRSF